MKDLKNGTEEIDASYLSMTVENFYSGIFQLYDSEQSEKSIIPLHITHFLFFLENPDH